MGIYLVSSLPPCRMHVRSSLDDWHHPLATPRRGAAPRPMLSLRQVGCHEPVSPCGGNRNGQEHEGPDGRLGRGADLHRVMGD